MTKLSQQHFKHEILPNPTCTQKRVSLTFRLTKPVVPQRNTRATEHDNNASGYVPFDTFSLVHPRQFLPKTAWLNCWIISIVMAKWKMISKPRSPSHPHTLPHPIHPHHPLNLAYMVKDKDRSKIDLKRRHRPTM